MRLTKWTDYSLRVLMHCAATQHRSQPLTIQEIADRHAISRSHLMKIVMTLSALGWIESIRGRGGGIRLLVKPDSLTLGQVVRETESDFNLVECFDEGTNTCRLNHRCNLKSVLQDSLQAYLKVLDGVTLADILPKSGGQADVPIQTFFSTP
jgi:Rrf2 family nitric oxide-sensitive transcriptional repressor